MHHPQGQLNLFDNDEERDICTIGMLPTLMSKHFNTKNRIYLFFFSLPNWVQPGCIYFFSFRSSFIPIFQGSQQKKNKQTKKTDRNEQMNEKK